MCQRAGQTSPVWYNESEDMKTSEVQKDIRAIRSGETGFEPCVIGSPRPIEERLKDRRAKDASRQAGMKKQAFGANPPEISRLGASQKARIRDVRKV